MFILTITIAAGNKIQYANKQTIKNVSIAKGHWINQQNKQSSENAVKQLVAY